MRGCRSSTIGAVEIDGSGGTVFLPRTGMRVHLGGIGKGYAVDRAATILRGRGITDFMIQSGGDLYVAGRAAIDRGASASGIRAARRIGSSPRSTCVTARSARRATTSGSSCATAAAITTSSTRTLASRRTAAAA